VNKRMLVPSVVSAVALLAALVVTYTAFLSPPDAPREAPKLGTTLEPVPSRVESAKGGFAVLVPDGVSARKNGRTVTLTTSDRALVVTVGPIDGGSLILNSEDFLVVMRKLYTKVHLGETKVLRVDGREALSTSGDAVNARKIRIRFVNVLVKARPRNFAITSFSPFDSDPKTKLPVMNAITDGFTVLE
jgi:hypothetical protein